MAISANKNRGDHMKQVLTIILAIGAFATIATANTHADPRHQSALFTAIENQCGSFRNLEITSVVEEQIRVDNGIMDVEFVTTLAGEQRYEQNMFDSYIIVVKSSYADMYDHTTKNWGAYSVNSVTCVLK